MKFTIKNRYTAAVMLTIEGDTLALALSAAVKAGADLSGANLSGANLYGADLSRADLRSANLYGANLSGANLSRADLRSANLRSANLYGANLTGADLAGANLRSADLTGADLAGANLRSADLKNVPKIKDIHKAVYKAASRKGALDMGKWHTCGTTHCRAGWVVTLAGKKGKELEKKLGTASAAAAIYIKSDPKLKKVPDFYCDNAAAMRDMKKLAQQRKSVKAKKK